MISNEEEEGIIESEVLLEHFQKMYQDLEVVLKQVFEASVKLKCTLWALLISKPIDRSQ